MIADRGGWVGIALAVSREKGMRIQQGPPDREQQEVWPLNPLATFHSSPALQPALPILPDPEQLITSPPIP